MIRIAKAALAAALAGSVVAGCAGAATRFYTLSAAPSVGPVLADYRGPAFRIDAVHIPAAMDRAELVRAMAGDRFAVSDNDHWAAPLGELLRRVLTQDLAARLPNGKVVFPDAPKPVGAGGIVVDILALTPTPGAMVMDVSWTSLSYQAPGAGGVRPTAARQHTLRLTTPAAGAGVSGNAIALSALADQLAGAIAGTLAVPDA